MIKIRNKVFETNSSSTHSLAYSKNPNRKINYKGLELDAYHQCYDDVENGIMNIWFGEYGWGPALLREPREKLSYLLTQVANEIIDTEEESDLTWQQIKEKLMSDSKFTDILDLVKSKCPDIKGFRLLRPDEYVDDDEEPEFGYTYPIGYIDHQSWGTAHEVDPERLIFDDSVMVIIDNDNSDCFYDYRAHEDGIWHSDTLTWEPLPDIPPKKDPEELFEIKGYDFTNEDW